MQLGYHTICWGGVVGDATGVTSVKDLYYRTPGSMPTAISDISAAGYAGIEMFDGNVADYADQPAVLQGLLADAGLELVSVYTGGNFIYADLLDDELHRVSHAADLAQQFGAGNLVVGGGARRAAGTTDADYTALAAALDQVTDIAEQRGLTACYHPHLTTIVESPDELDRLMPQTPDRLLPRHGPPGRRRWRSRGTHPPLSRPGPTRPSQGCPPRSVRVPAAGAGRDRFRRRPGGAQRGRLRRMADRRTRFLRR